MKERPILFSGPMVRAILEGRKTQTRRVFPRKYLEWIDEPRGPEDVAAGYPFICGFDSDEECISALQLCPYGHLGDRLWVREAWHQKGEWRLPEHPEAEWEDAYWIGTKDILYAADAKIPSSGWRARPSIHMPRWACRLVLEITDVRVERLQDISEADARAEGCHGGHGSIPGYNYSATPREQFWQLWESLNAGRGYCWDANPWVWAITFRRVRG